MACDICGKTGTSLSSLNSEYQTEKIKSLCDECLRTTNDHLWEFRRMSNKMNEGFLKRFMENLKHKFSA